MSFLYQFLVGAGVSWPAVLLGYFLSRKKTRDHIDEVTASQTRDLTAGLARVTNAQTATLRRALGEDPAPPDRLPEAADPDRFA